MKPIKQDRPNSHKHMVKNRHSDAYNQAMTLLIKQMQHINHTTACSCGFSVVSGIGGFGKLDLICDECNTHLFTKSMEHERFGHTMNDEQKKFLREGLCGQCGNDNFLGKLYIPSKNKWIFQYYCTHCQYNYVLIDKNLKLTKALNKKTELNLEENSI
jgi:hypothetical protein